MYTRFVQLKAVTVISRDNNACLTQILYSYRHVWSLCILSHGSLIIYPVSYHFHMDHWLITLHLITFTWIIDYLCFILSRSYGSLVIYPVSYHFYTDHWLYALHVITLISRGSLIIYPSSYHLSHGSLIIYPSSYHFNITWIIDYLPFILSL